MKELNRDMVRTWLPKRPAEGHKGTFGRAGILAGAEGYTGAPWFASEAAVRGGAGLVFLGVPRCIYPIEAMKCREAMPSPLPDEDGMLSAAGAEQALSLLNKCDAGLVGPGLGQSIGVEELVRKVVCAYPNPLILDADGINTIARHIDKLDSRTSVTILTPHDGEYARLSGHLPDSDRGAEAEHFAAQHGCILVLKGHRTIIAAPDGRSYWNPTGNNGMAKGGSGDVLGGLMLSLLAQGMEAAQAASAAVWIHGAAGDLAAQRLGCRGMTPTDLLGFLPEVLQTLE